MPLPYKLEHFVNLKISAAVLVNLMKNIHNAVPLRFPILLRGAGWVSRNGFHQNWGFNASN